MIYCSNTAVFPRISEVRDLEREMYLWSILVVDDNPMVRRLICELFSLEGDFHVCAEAENGRDALLKAQATQPSMVVTDLSMPVMNGLEEIRALNKLMPDVPVILYSAQMDPYVEKEAFAAGASAVVSKMEVVLRLIPTARALLAALAA